MFSLTAHEIFYPSCVYVHRNISFSIPSLLQIAANHVVDHHFVFGVVVAMRISSYMVIYYTNAGLNCWFNETRGCSYLCSVDTNTCSGWRTNKYIVVPRA